MQRFRNPQVVTDTAVQRGPYYSAVLLEAFEYTPVVRSTSYIIAEYNLLNTSSLTIGRPLDPLLTDNDTFALAIRCQGPGNVTLRYVLTPKDDLPLFYPEYNGHTIYQDAVLEVWVRANSTHYAQLADDVVIYTNTFDRQQPGESANLDDGPVTLVATEFVETPTGETNPFSDDLELAGLGSGIGTAFPPLHELPVAAVSLRGSGSPEGVVTADVGEWYYDELNEQFYFKDTGTGNTGWIIVV